MEQDTGADAAQPAGNWLSVADAAARLRISHRGVLSRIQRGKVEARIDPRDPQKRRFQVRAEDLELDESTAARQALGVRTPLSNILEYLEVAQREIANVDSAVGDILAGADDNGIVRILPPRRTNVAYQSEVISLLQRTTGIVRIMGISCNGFFADGVIGSELVRTLRRASKPESQPQEARFLILYPCGNAARARMFAEEHDPDHSLNESTLFLDIEKTLKRVRTLYADGLNLQVRLYDFVPYHQLVLFNEGCLVEQYGFGSIGDQRGVGCIGGFAPIIKCKPSSAYYTSLLNGFDHVWNGAPRENCLSVYTDISAVLKEMERRGKEKIIPGTERRAKSRRAGGR